MPFWAVTDVRPKRAAWEALKDSEELGPPKDLTGLSSDPFGRVDLWRQRDGAEPHHPSGHGALLGRQSFISSRKEYK